MSKHEINHAYTIQNTHITDIQADTYTTIKNQ